MGSNEAPLDRKSWFHEKSKQLINELKRGVKRPATYVIIVTIVVVAIFSTSNCISTFFNREISQVIISIASTVLGAAVVSFWLDAGKMEDRIRRLGCNVVLNDAARILSGDTAILENIDGANLRALSQKALMAKYGLPPTSGEIDSLVDICFNEIEPKIHGLYRSHFEVKRDVFPVKNAEGNTVAWRVHLDVQQDMKNASNHPLDIPLGLKRTSGPIENNIAQGSKLEVKEYSVQVNGVSKFTLQEPASVECKYTEEGKRVWDPFLPNNEKIPTTINPGELFHLHYNAEFITPIAEEVTVNWASPIKGVVYRVSLHDISDYKAEISLNGCALCEGGRKRSCTSCNNKKGVIEFTNNGLEIIDHWTGSDMGICVEWIKCNNLS